MPSSESSVANFRRQTRWRDATDTTWELKLKLHLDKLINQVLRLKTETFKVCKQTKTGPDWSRRVLYQKGADDPPNKKFGETLSIVALKRAPFYSKFKEDF